MCARRSARVGDEIGGHNVAGHVHTTAQITSVQDTPENRTITFAVRSYCSFQLHCGPPGAMPRLQVPQKWLKYIFSKGFIAVDGISLTVLLLCSQALCFWWVSSLRHAGRRGVQHRLLRVPHP